MPSERIYRIAFVETTMDARGVGATFAQCGGINAIYPFKTGDRHKSVHFFVEFDQQASVKRARALQLRDAKVHVVAYSPQLTEDFIRVAPPASERASTPQRPTEPQLSPLRPWSQGRHSSPYWYSNRAANRKGKAKAQGRQGTSTSGTALSAPPNAHEGVARGGAHNKENQGGFFEGLAALPPLPSPLPYLSGSAMQGTSQPGEQRIHPKLKAEPMSSPVRLALPSPAGPSRPATPTPAPPPEPRILTLSHGENVFSCNLEELPDDPSKIATILRDTCSQAVQRDKWMIVASYYRGQGNHSAALAVVSTMVDVLTSPAVALSEADLKPAFLMMASCHMDLGKLGPARDAEQHKVKAQKFLCKVYGSTKAADKAMAGAPPTTLKLLHPREASPAKRTLAQVEESHRLLEREVQSLRSRHVNNLTSLGQARSETAAKEGQLYSERVARANAERELAEALQEVGLARRAEKCALDQCKREVENRRRCEERVNELAGEVSTLQRELDDSVRASAERERQTRDTFDQFGVMFMKAAHNELDLVSAHARSSLNLPGSSPATAYRDRTPSGGQRAGNARTPVA